MEWKKTDRRVRHTKTAIQQSLLKWMKSRPIDKITVTEICELANINRGTFYAHYAGPYALLVQIEMELFDEINRTIEKTSNGNGISELLLEIFQSIAGKADLCKILFSEYGDKEFLKKIVYIGHDRSISEWKSIRKDVSEDTLELLYSFVANGIAGIIQDWLQSGMKQSPKEIAELAGKISYHGLRSCIP